MALGRPARVLEEVESVGIACDESILVAIGESDVEIREKV